MRMRGVSGRSRGRATARGGAVLAAVLMAGMIPGAQASDGSREIDTELTYSCEFPAGAQQVKVRISATVPEEGRADEAVQLTGVSTELTLPAESLAGPTGAWTSSVEAETRLTVGVTQGGHSAEAVWAGATENPVAVPDAGELTLAAPGEVPSVTAGTSGDLTFTAGKLTVLLTAPKTDATQPEPSTVQLACTPESDQDLTLAAVRVAEGEEGPAAPWPSETEGNKGSDGVDIDRDDAAPRVGPEKSSPAGEVPPCRGDKDNPFSLVAYVTGYANVAKLRSATQFPVACTQIEQGATKLQFIDGHLHLLQDSTALLDYRGKPQLPPATGTFLTFGFMPTTATMEMTQIPPAIGTDGKPVPNIHSDATILGPGNSVSTTSISMNLTLRLSDVKVNGVPLDVGGNCRTERPFALALRGDMLLKDGVQTGYTLVTGGPLKGEVTLPPFTGCGVDEDLDSLFTASISGVPGYVKQMQGAPCAAASYDPALCTEERQPVKIPKPER